MSLTSFMLRFTLIRNWWLADYGQEKKGRAKTLFKIIPIDFSSNNHPFIGWLDSSIPHFLTTLMHSSSRYSLPCCALAWLLFFSFFSWLLHAFPLTWELMTQCGLEIRQLPKASSNSFQVSSLAAPSCCLGEMQMFCSSVVCRIYILPFAWRILHVAYNRWFTHAHTYKVQQRFALY